MPRPIPFCITLYLVERQRVGALAGAPALLACYPIFYITDVKDTFFGGSFASLVSFFVQKEHYDEKELEELKQLMETIEAKNQ